MSIEAALAENTATMKELIGVLKETNVGRAEALAAAKAATEKVGTGTKAKTETATTTPNTETTTTSTGASATEGTEPTEADVMNALKAYATQDEAEKAARKEKINELLKKVKVASFKDIKPAHRAGFIKAVETLIAAGNVLQPAGEPDASADDADPFS